jgi:hypothetical protein
VIAGAKRNDGEVGGGASDDGGDEHGSEREHYVGAERVSGSGEEQARLENVSARRSM